MHGSWDGDTVELQIVVMTISDVWIGCRCSQRHKQQRNNSLPFPPSPCPIFS